MGEMIPLEEIEFSEEFITKNADEISNWDEISRNITVSCFSETFFERFRDKIDFWLVYVSDNMTTELCHKSYVNLGWKAHFLDGKMHKEDGPAIVYDDGREEWYFNNKKHREDGPAVIHVNGREEWFRDGKCHREGGPAITKPNGFEMWYINGVCYREDGPSVIYSSGDKEWWENGKCIKKQSNGGV